MHVRLLVPVILLLGCVHREVPFEVPPGASRSHGDLFPHDGTGTRRVKHLNLDLTVDFQARRVQGVVELDSTKTT
jgi:hypothetical protein